MPKDDLKLKTQADSRILILFLPLLIPHCLLQCSQKVAVWPQTLS